MIRIILALSLISSICRANENHSLIPIAYYTPETSVAYGLLDVYVFNAFAKNQVSSLETIAVMTAKKQTILTLTPDLVNQDGSIFYGGYFNYRFYPNEYFGTGETRFSKSEKYTENRLRWNAYIRPRLFGDFFARATVLSDKIDIIDTEDSPEIINALDGRFEKIQSQGVRFSFEYDTRDILTSTTSGHFLRVNQEWNEIRDRNTQGKIMSAKSEFEGRAFYDYGVGRLAHHVLISHLSADEGYPFYLYQIIGGSTLMKGYKAGEYRDFNLVMNQNEWRSQFNTKWGYQGFVNFAKLSNRFEDVLEADLRVSGGGGISYLFNAKTQTKLRLDVGWSQESFGIYFVTGETF